MESSTCSKCGGRIIFRHYNGQVVPIHLSGACSTGGSSLRARSNNQLNNNKPKKALVIKAETNVARKGKIVRSFTIPNAKCPVCNDKVFFYQNEYGSKVYFDELGPPWPKHPCTDSMNSNGEKTTKQLRKNWSQFFIESCKEKKISHDKYIITWKGFHNQTTNAFSKSITFSTSSPIPKKDIILSTVYINQGAGDKITLNALTKDVNHEFIELKSFEKIELKNVLWLGEKRKKRKKRKLNPVINLINRNNDSYPIPYNEGNDKLYPGLDLEPFSETYNCPLCTSYYDEKEKLKNHLKTHYQKGKLGVFEKLSFDQWAELMLKNNSV